GSYAVVEAVRQHRVRKLLYAASSSCYGVPEIYPTPETAAIDPRYPYALTKYLGEQILLHWGQVYDLPVTSLRLFNVYVPWARTSCTYGDTTRITSELGWKAAVPIEDGVAAMMANLEYWRDAPVWTADRIADATQDWFKYIKDA